MKRIFSHLFSLFRAKKHLLPRRCSFLKYVFLGIGLICVVLFIIRTSGNIQGNQNAVQEMQKNKEHITNEVLRMRNVVLSTCQENNEVRTSILLPEVDCTKYFPELSEESFRTKTLAEEFLVALHLLVSHRDEERILQYKAYQEENTWEKQGKRTNKNGGQERDKNIQHAFQGDFFTDDSLLELTSDAGIQQYLNSFGLALTAEEESLLLRTQISGEQRKTIARIAWGDEKHNVLFTLEDENISLPLGGLSQILSEIRLQEQERQREQILRNITNATATGDEYTHIALLGKHATNVDTIILASLNHHRRTISLISLPRDLWLGSLKVNAWYGLFGMDSFLRKLERILGQSLSGYVLVDMFAFPEIIDGLGGISYTFDQPLVDPTYRTVDNGKEGSLFFSQGTHHLNGIQALRVARSRHTTSDFSRSDRQQTLLREIRAKVQSHGTIQSVMRIAPVLMKYVETNLTTEEAIHLLWRAKEYTLNTGNVMSTGNIFVSEEYALGNQKKIYIIQPREGNWDLIKQFVVYRIRGSGE